MRVEERAGVEESSLLDEAEAFAVAFTLRLEAAARDVAFPFKCVGSTFPSSTAGPDVRVWVAAPGSDVDGDGDVNGDDLKLE